MKMANEKLNCHIVLRLSAPFLVVMTNSILINCVAMTINAIISSQSLDFHSFRLKRTTKSKGMQLEHRKKSFHFNLKEATGAGRCL